jgi:hypothetical protein
LTHGLTQQAALEPAVVDGRDQGVDGQPLQFGSIRLESARQQQPDHRAEGRVGVERGLVNR